VAPRLFADLTGHVKIPKTAVLTFRANVRPLGLWSRPRRSKGLATA
jgi:hypothetical protein